MCFKRRHSSSVKWNAIKMTKEKNCDKQLKCTLIIHLEHGPVCALQSMWAVSTSQNSAITSFSTVSTHSICQCDQNTKYTTHNKHRPSTDTNRNMRIVQIANQLCTYSRVQSNPKVFCIVLVFFLFASCLAFIHMGLHAHFCHDQNFFPHPKMSGVAFC